MTTALSFSGWFYDCILYVRKGMNGNKEWKETGGRERSHQKKGLRPCVSFQLVFLFLFHKSETRPPYKVASRNLGEG